MPSIAYPGSAPPPLAHTVMSTPYYPHVVMPHTAPAFYPKVVSMHQRVPPPLIVPHPRYYENRPYCDCTDGCCLCTCLTTLCCALCFCDDEPCICCY
ncbi:unnamed protein product [Absidia cylindrospora]